MSDESKFKYRFSPRPEPRPMDWEYLMSPVRDAVRELLIRIDGATKAPNHATNCFLVHGERGTGKTTVLHSAKAACDPKGSLSFFGRKQDAHYFDRGTPIETMTREEASESAKQLSRAVWLDILDLEPLPPGTNLLTTVLTRVRNAPGSTDAEAVRSILEESANSARHQLGELINDATLMWEDIREQDTRSRANRQVAAAGIYARFHERFKKALESLSRELGRQYGSGEGDEHCPIILPVDNIDRSVEHLYSIVKLAEMVSSPHLWLVMAGDRQEVETFLERAYWKELIRIGESGAGATGKMGVSGEDEALVMARRQAAAASHRLLPPSHRVKVGVVRADETLAFKPASVPGQPENIQSIREMLQGIPLINEEEAKEETARLSLISLFDRTALMRDMDLMPDVKKQDNYLTEAAQLGLSLPARRVLDLWHLAYWAANDDLIVKKHHKAEMIARTMLRNTISESTMSSEMGRRLQERVLRPSSQGGTILDFWDPRTRISQLEVLRLRSLEFSLQAGTERLDVIQTKWINLQFFAGPSKNKWTGNVGISDPGKTLLWNRMPDGSTTDVATLDLVSGLGGDQLPDMVAAWLIVLYDVVMWGAVDSVVICGPTIRPAIVVEWWPRSAEGSLPPRPKEWPSPQWKSFIAHDVHREYWRHFLDRLTQRGSEAKMSLLEQAGKEGCLPRLLAAGWTACAIEAFLALAPREGKWGGSREKLQKLKVLLDKMSCGEQGVTEAIQAAEKHVEEAAATTREEIQRTNVRGGILRYVDETAEMLGWLEQGRPLLVQYVSGFGSSAKTRAQTKRKSSRVSSGA